MKSLKKSKYLFVTIAMAIFTLTSCESENIANENPDPIDENQLSGMIELSSYEIDFGNVNVTANANAKSSGVTEEVITLFNNTEEVLTSLGSQITFPGNAGVNLTFEPVAPGGSISVPFTYSPDGLAPGEYTGEAKLIPSIGEEIIVTLKATVVE